MLVGKAPATVSSPVLSVEEEQIHAGLAVASNANSKGKGRLIEAEEPDDRSTEGIARASEYDKDDEDDEDTYAIDSDDDHAYQGTKVRGDTRCTLYV